MFTLAFSLSLTLAFVGWHVAGLLAHTGIRAIARATVVAAFCAPSVLVGHGIAVLPGVLGMIVQPSPYTFIPAAITWVSTLGTILWIPALRTSRLSRAFSPAEVFASAYPAKLFFVGLIAYGIPSMTATTELRHWLVTFAAPYGLFLACAAANFALCRLVTRARQTNIYLVPLLFVAPNLLGANPIRPVIWYAAGLIGALVASDRKKPAARLALAAFAALALYAAYRAFVALDAAPHLHISGGVAGNAVSAVAFLLLGIASWLLLRLPAREDRRRQ